MRIIRDYQYVTEEDRGAVAAIGNFDGVHLGHRSVIETAKAEAERRGVPLAVLTFEPHPRQVFAPNAPDFRLTNAESRAHRLEQLGVDILFELSFTKTLAALSPHDFAANILKNGLGLSHVVVGQDFVFGKAREGNIDTLHRFGDEMGFGTTVAPLLDIEGEGEVHSTEIRKALIDGRPRDAARMLGHWHRIVGEVVRGDQRGRDLGFPTANMWLHGLLKPRFGIYAALVEVLEGPHKGNYQGAASLGLRPTFGGKEPNLETFIFDFRGDLYGTRISVGLVEFLRPEVKFNGIEALIEQMDADCVKTRQILSEI